MLVVNAGKTGGPALYAALHCTALARLARLLHVSQHVCVCIFFVCPAGPVGGPEQNRKPQSSTSRQRHAGGTTHTVSTSKPQQQCCCCLDSQCASCKGFMLVLQWVLQAGGVLEPLYQ
jgi:hypothetical protein